MSARSGALKKILENFFAVCKAKDVIIVLATGNDGTNKDHDLDRTLPQVLATSASPLIVVGGVHNNGRLWTGTTPSGQLGEISTYAQGTGVGSQDYQGKYNVMKRGNADLSSGSSFACPAVVSLIPWSRYVSNLQTGWHGSLLAHSTSV